MKNNKCWVVKIGSALLTNNGKGIDKDLISEWVEQIVELQSHNIDVVLVSSGSIVEGMKRLGWKDKPTDIHKLQAAAAVGQMGLVQAYEYLFAKHKVQTAQVLLTQDNLINTKHFENISATLENLLEFGAVPVINENDTVATDELKFGDNDRLAARVAQIIGADILIIFSDVNGLYNKDKKRTLIKEVKDINEEIYSFAEKKINNYGSGGMITKLDAAKICMNAGCYMFIANGKKNNPLQNMIKNKVYTCFTPKISNLDARKKWIISSLNSQGKLCIDFGAAKALSNGKSLLAAGIIKVLGKFKKGDNILIIDLDNNNIARGLSSFSSEEINKIKGKQSSEIQAILGYPSKSEIIHKDDMVKM